MVEARGSIVVTSLVAALILVMLAGLALVFVPIGGSIEVATAGVSLKTTHLGVALVALGGGLATLVVRRLPPGVQLFGAGRPTGSDRLYELRWLVVVLSACAFAAAIVRVAL